MELTLIEIRR